MAAPREPHSPPSRTDGEGVRAVAKPRRARDRAWPWAVAVAAVSLAGVLAWWLRSPAPASDAAATVAGAGRDRASAATTAGVASTGPSPSTPQHKPPPMPGDDPDDLASYFASGDPEPTGAQVIEALQQAGVRTGIGAFNPPGTSPPLVGLAVPADFELPPGYVRHHQVTDEGVPIEPIPMFSPDFTLYDDRGRPVAMPADRVVPPALAPPGLPLRRIQVPPR